jgi:hypothetical protein
MPSALFVPSLKPHCAIAQSTFPCGTRALINVHPSGQIYRILKEGTKESKLPAGFARLDGLSVERRLPLSGSFPFSGTSRIASMSSRMHSAASRRVCSSFRASARSVIFWR